MSQFILCVYMCVCVSLLAKWFSIAITEGSMTFWFN